MNESDEVAALRSKANAGDAAAQFNLGAAYYTGQGVPQDYAEAVSWTRKAADQGYVDAMGSLGYAYDRGQGVPQDDLEAHKWLNLAASPASAEKHTRYAESRDAVAEKMTPQQIADAQQRAIDWLAAFEQRGGK